MQKGFKFFLTILFVVVLVFSVEGCSDLYKDSETANVSFSLNFPKEFFTSRNAADDDNIATVSDTNNWLKIVLYFENGTKIDDKKVDIVEGQKVKISFDSIPVGAKVYATAEAYINGVQYSDKTAPELIKRGVNTLKLVLKVVENGEGTEPDNPELEPEIPSGDGNGTGEGTGPTKFTVTFNANGGTFEDGNDTKEFSVEENQIIQEIQPSKHEGYSFDFWYVENSNESFDFNMKITSDLTLYAKWHLDSQYMLFSKGYDAESKQDVYTFAMTSDLSSGVEHSINVADEVIDFTIGGGDFYYYITKSSDGVFLRRTDNEIQKIIPVDPDYVNKISNYIYWDYEFDKLYVLQIKLDGDTPNNNTIEKVLLYDPSNEEEPSVSFDITNDYSVSLIKNDYSIYDFAVHNDKLYIGFSNPDKGLYVSEFEINENTITFNKDIQVDKNISYNNNPICLNDMIWMNDSLYLLWSSNGGSSSEIAYTYQSYGNIFRMAETKDNEYSFSKLNLPSINPFVIKYNNEDNNEETCYCSYYGPSSENDNNFLFGPTKFIAIKPKKLVVADEGILIYEDENENDFNKIKMKNIDRVVELDLDINSITPPTILHDITFNKESVEELQIVCSYLYLTEDGLKVVE